MSSALRACSRNDRWVDLGRAAGTSSQVSATLRAGMREWVLARHAETGQHVLYWITPKAAHTFIVRLLRQPPWVTLNVSGGFASAHESWSGATEHGAQDRAQRLLSTAVRRHAPLEFTFVREPIAHLVSAAGQLAFCLQTWHCIAHNHTWWPLAEAADVLRMLEIARRDELPAEIDRGGPAHQRRPSGRGWYRPCAPRERAAARVSLRSCARHLYPQTSGYTFSGSPGLARRVSFLGRIERLAEDWARLNHLLASRALVAAARSPHRRVEVVVATRKANDRHGSLRYSMLQDRGAVRAALAASNVARQWLLPDKKCIAEAGAMVVEQADATSPAPRMGLTRHKARQRRWSCMLLQQTSRHSACVRNVSFGCAEEGDLVWVSNGCRGRFRCYGHGRDRSATDLDCGHGGQTAETTAVCMCTLPAPGSHSAAWQVPEDSLYARSFQVL